MCFAKQMYDTLHACLPLRGSSRLQFPAGAPANHDAARVATEARQGGVLLPSCTQTEELT
ncbi:Hypothetical protein SMAX5B_005437 [Scophthalmus maximus]|uniref:Uncharacterized protein n=1 Tax=Scophthalmus maximus TaxID=52904 RepID=A0A2U9B1W1_SCOMX|nr:Hypothetical protein SMAX5B_005437 [Scophthalmus maximus]